MYISKLIIKNYKSIKDETFIFNKGINILVGKNNAGKSNIVSALNEILADKYNTTSYEDKIFYTDSTNNIKREFKIIAEIEDIKTLEFSLLDNIKKSTALIDITQYFNENDEEFNNDWLIKDDDELKEIYPDKFDYKSINLLKWFKKEELENILSNTEKIWIYKYYNKDNDVNLYNIILKVDENSNNPFDSTKSIKFYRMIYINQNIKATLITSLLIPAFRTPETTLRITKWTWYGKLLQKKWNESCNMQHKLDIDKASSDLKKTIGKVYADLKNDLNVQLGKTLSLMNIKIDINMLENKSEDYYKNIRLYVDDGIETPLESKGSGLQSLIMIELFKFYCKVFNQSSLLILEEPELFLHPHAKRMLSDILNDFIKNGGRNNENQIIITTHSEEFIHNVDIENINVIRKTKEGTKKSRINKENYGDGKELQKLKIELQHKNTEMFFAEKVILVEGEEQILIPNIVQKIYGKNILNNNDISIIKVGGKFYFYIYRKVLNELNIKNYIIADYDILNRGLETLLEECDKNKLNTIRSQIDEEIKNNKSIKKETNSRDWKYLASILDEMTEKNFYDNRINEIWANFRTRIFKKNKLEDLNQDLKVEILNFITDMYNKDIFIMKKGELEDYYKEENFGSEFLNINAKGIKAYKISELAESGKIDKYMNIDEYKVILSYILGKPNVIKSYKKLSKKHYKRIGGNSCAKY